MDAPPEIAGADKPSVLPRVVVMTMVRDEAQMLRWWLAHYGREFGHESLLVLDDNSIDGSTDDLPCACYRIPPGPWKARWGKTRTRLVNGLAAGLLACNDFVIYTDVDELLVADPNSFAGLRDYLSRTRADVIAPVALELVHHPRLEPPLDPSQAVLKQRSFVKYSPGMSKPLVKSTNSRWDSAFHSSSKPFHVDPDLWLFHLKFADQAILRQTARHRAQAHRLDGRGHPRSFWSMPEEVVVAKLAEWTAGVVDAPEFDPAEVELTDLIRQNGDGMWASTANQVRTLDATPIRRVPERFRGAF